MTTLNACSSLLPTGGRYVTHRSFKKKSAAANTIWNQTFIFFFKAVLTRVKLTFCPYFQVPALIILNLKPDPNKVKSNSVTLMQIFVENKIQILTSDPEKCCMVDLQSLFIIFICIAFSRSRYNDLVTTSLWNTHWEIWGWYSLSFESRIKGKHITQRLKSFLEVALSQIRRSLSLVKY